MVTRILVGGLGFLLYFLGRGVRISDAAAASDAEYTFGVACQLLGAALFVLAFTVWRHSRLRGPRAGQSVMVVLGWLHLAMAALLFWAMISLIVMAIRLEAPAREVFTGLIVTPDFMLRLVTAVLALGAGATALAKASAARILLRAVAIPLATIWPHGLLLAAWAAWSSIPPPAPEPEVAGASDAPSAAG